MMATCGQRTFVKYLHGVESTEASVECRKGQAGPAWHAP